MKVLLILFVIKLYARNNVFKFTIGLLDLPRHEDADWNSLNAEIIVGKGKCLPKFYVVEVTLCLENLEKFLLIYCYIYLFSVVKYFASTEEGSVLISHIGYSCLTLNYTLCRGVARTSANM